MALFSMAYIGTAAVRMTTFLSPGMLDGKVAYHLLPDFTAIEPIARITTGPSLSMGSGTMVLLVKDGSEQGSARRSWSA